MIDVIEINDIGLLAEHADDWRRLLRATPGARFFQSLEWLQVYWKHYGAGKRLRVLLVVEGSQPIGILPLLVAREPTRVGRLRFLTYPLDYWGSCYGPIGDRPQATLAAGLKYLAATRRDWDVLDLRWVLDAGDACAAAEGALAARRMRPWRTVIDQTSLVDLPASWDEYLAARTSKWRNNFKRWQKRLAQRGQLRHVRYRPAGREAGEEDPRWDLFEDCVEVARASWQGTSPDGTTLSHESVAPFLRDVHVAAAAAGGVDVNLLYLDEQPVAFAYNYHFGGNVDGLRIGYDPAAGRDGVGNLLYARVIEDSIHRGDALYDLGPGSLDIKRHLRSRVATIYRYRHIPPLALRANLLRLKRLAAALPGKRKQAVA